MAVNKNNRLSVKGLDKIFGEGINDVIRDIEKDETIKEKASSIPLDEVHPNPHQPRKVFDDIELAGLAESIKKHGIIQPIIVKKTVNGYNIVAGERRTRAARLAGLETIPAVEVDFNDEQMKEIALIENIQRVDLTPIEEAIAYKELCELLDLTQEDLAKRVGKSRSHIANTVRLLNLPQSVQDLVLDKTLTMGQVRPLLTIEKEDELLALTNEIVTKRLNSREIEMKVKTLHSSPIIIGGKGNEKPKSPRDINKYLEEKIMHKLGTRVTIEANKITIKYNGIGDLNRILDILKLTDRD